MLGWTGPECGAETLGSGFCVGPTEDKKDLVHGEMDGDGTLGSQEGNLLHFTSSIKFPAEPHPPT